MVKSDLKHRFAKFHGLGNDFVLLDNRKKLFSNYSELAQKLCHRRFSIGADGILILEDSDIAHFKMLIFNSDGSEAEMCGNGIRCFALYLFNENILPYNKMEIETKAGIIRPVIEKCKSEDNYLVRVDMGKPELIRKNIPMKGKGDSPVIDEKINIEGSEYVFSAVSMGNPHCIIFTDQMPNRNLLKIGPLIENSEFFPEKTNVEFVKVIDPGYVKVQVWERGAGETWACGTGACAVGVAGILKGILKEKVTVSLPGGDLVIEWDKKGSVIMTGPALEAYRGEVNLY